MQDIRNKPWVIFNSTDIRWHSGVDLLHSPVLRHSVELAPYKMNLNKNILEEHAIFFSHFYLYYKTAKVT